MSAQRAGAANATATAAAQIEHANNTGEQSERSNALAALRAASDICHATPNQPVAHYAYDQAWSALGDHR